MNLFHTFLIINVLSWINVFARHPVEIYKMVKIASRYNWGSNNVTFLGIKISQNSNVFPFKSQYPYKRNYRVAFYIMPTCMDAP